MSKTWTSRALPRLLPELVFPALVVLLFADPLFLRKSFAGRDLLPYHLPVEREIHDAWARGAVPLWSAHISGGRPLAPNPNVGAFHPVRLALAFLPFETAFRIYPVVHWIAAGLGMLALARALGAGAGASWIGAVTYVFSGVGIGEVFYTNIQPGMALLPWVLWAAVRPVPDLAGRVLPTAAFLALDLYSGDVFTIGMALAACGLWLAVETRPGHRLRELLALAGAGALALLLAAPQLVATALWVPWTTRAVGGLPLAVATTFSVSPWRLLELAVPYPFGASWSLDLADFWGRSAFRTFFPTLFCGGLALVSLVSLAALRRSAGRGHRFVRWYFAGAAFVCVAPSLLPAAWGSWKSPIPLRYPEKFAVALVFALALAAALGLPLSDRSRSLARGTLAVAAALGVVAVVAVTAPEATGALAARAIGATAASPAAVGRQISVAFAEAGLLWAATAAGLDLRSRGSRGAGLAALALWTAVPVLATRRVAPTFPSDTIFAPSPFARFAARRDPAMRFRELDASRFRAPDPRAAAQRHPPGVELYRQSWFFYTPALWGRGTVLNADPDVGDLSRTESLRLLSARFPAVPNGAALFSSLSLRHAIRYAAQEPLPGFVPAGGDALQSWDENPSAAASVRVVSRWRGARGAVEALGAFPGLRDGEVVIENGLAGSGVDPGARLADLDETPERVRFSVVSPAPAWIFVLRGFWPHREVTVDGAPAETVPAQLAFSALLVPAGSHRVEWRERLPGGTWSWTGPVAALLAVLALLRARRPAVSAPAS